MIRAAAIALMLMPASADALSCMRPDAVRVFLDAQASPDVYRVLVGTLDFDASAMPRHVQMGAGARDPAPVPAHFTGMGLGLGGLVDTAPMALTLVPQCAGPWCGRLEPSGILLMFARDTATGPEVVIDPCQSSIFSEPTAETINALTACLRGDACEPDPPRR